MTGFGEAHCREDGLAVAVEVRTINSRYLKLTFRGGDDYALLEPEIEAVVRQSIRRGSVQVSLRVDRATSPDDFRINREVLASYIRQLESCQNEWHLADSPTIASLLPLPGVVVESPSTAKDPMADWPLIRRTLEAAMSNLSAMREQEGRAMAADLAANCELVATQLTSIEARAPAVAEQFRQRLTDRVKKVLAEHNVTLDSSDVIREVSIFAERSDISEETVRLRSHLVQFEEIVNLPESSGRKLDFLTQEMFRETNTIGSKSNDVEISRHVIEIKAAVERIREMIQNVE